MKIQQSKNSDLYFVSPDECKTVAQYNLLCEWDTDENDWGVKFFETQAEIEALIKEAKEADRQIQSLAAGRVGIEVRISHRNEHAFYTVHLYQPKDNEGVFYFDENYTEYDSRDPKVSPENIVKAVAFALKFSDLSLQGQYEVFNKVAKGTCVEVATSYVNKDDKARIGSLGVGLVYGFGVEGLTN